MDKKSLREIVNSRNIELNQIKREDKSEKIVENLIDQIKESHNRIALFYPMESEPDIKPFITHLLDCGKEVFLPMITSIKERKMVFTKLHSLDDLTICKYGIPVSANGEIGSTFDIVIVPSVGVGDGFYRLGMGGGFYDSYFNAAYQKDHKETEFITPVYSSSTNLEFASDSWDLVVDVVVTEDGVRKR